MNEEIWLNNFFVLFRRDKILDIYPKKDESLEEKMNSITRAVIYLTIGGFIFTKSYKILISGIVTLFVIAILYKSQKGTQKKNKIKKIAKEGFTNPEFYNAVKDNFTQPTKQNPLMNVTLNEYIDNPKRKQAAPAYNPAVEKEINEKFKENIDSRLFQDLGDELEFENSMRNFYTVPGSTIPNDRETFMKFCYGNMASCKDGDYIQCEKNNYRYTNP